MILRQATHVDGAQIAAIWNQIIRDTLTTFNAVEKSVAEVKRLMDETVRKDRAFLVAERGGEIIGFASYAQFRGGVGYAHTMEHSVYLAPHERGTGVGRALMMAIEEHARSRGVHVMIAGVSAENSGAIGFHKALGYCEMVRLPQVGRKFNRWLDLVLLQKIL